MDRESVPISGQSPANFGACQIHPCSAAIRGLHPSATTLLALDRRNRCCAGSRDFAPPLSMSHLSARVQNPTHSLSLSLSPYATLVHPINPRGALEGLCTRSRRKTASAMIAVYGREKPSRLDDVIAISSLSRNSNCGKKMWSRMIRHYVKTTRIY